MKSVNVKTLQGTIKSRQCEVPEKPGIYRWWFKEEGAKKLLSVLPDIEIAKVQTRTIYDEQFFALYFGISKNIRERIRWHITQSHTPSSVKSGYISTLRLSLSALLGICATQSEEYINKFIDEYCIIEYKPFDTIEKANKLEKQELSTKYYPMNISNNKMVNKNIKSELIKLRKKYKC